MSSTHLRISRWIMKQGAHEVLTPSISILGVIALAPTEDGHLHGLPCFRALREGHRDLLGSIHVTSFTPVTDVVWMVCRLQDHCTIRMLIVERGGIAITTNPTMYHILALMIFCTWYRGRQISAPEVRLRQQYFFWLSAFEWPNISFIAHIPQGTRIEELV